MPLCEVGEHLVIVGDEGVVVAPALIEHMDDARGGGGSVPRATAGRRRVKRRDSLVACASRAPSFLVDPHVDTKRERASGNLYAAAPATVLHARSI